VTGVPTLNKVDESRGATIAVDSTIAVADMLVLDPARVTAIVRVFKFSVCVTRGVVKVDVSAHTLFAGNTDPPDVNVIDAVAVVESATEAVKVVEPQPLAEG